MHLLDLTFRQAGAAVQVESRVGTGEMGYSYVARETLEPAAWAIIERCAGRPVTVRSPD